MQSFKLMAYVFGALAFSAPAWGGTCDSGPVFSQDTDWVTNDAINTMRTIYTAPANGNGTKITAVYISNNQIVQSGNTFFQFYTVHNGNAAYLLQGNATYAGQPNVINTSPFAGPLLNQPTDGNGDVYIFVSPGDSLSAANGIAITGSAAGTYSIHVMGQQC